MRHVPGVEPSIRDEGSSMIYLGGLSAMGYDMLMRLSEQGNTSALAITSPGGSEYCGIKIGEIVYNNGWDVHVRGLCMSSCADYIVPAGRNKVLEDGGVVGRRCSARQDYFFAEQRGISGRQQIVNSLSGALQMGSNYLTYEEFNQEIASFVAEHETLVELEHAFYERIGLDANVSVCVHLPKRFKSIEWSGGWTFTLDDMAKFGLDGNHLRGQ